MASPPKMGNQPTFRDVARRGPPVMDQVPTTEISKHNQAKDFQSFARPTMRFQIIQETNQSFPRPQCGFKVKRLVLNEAKHVQSFARPTVWFD